MKSFTLTLPKEIIEVHRQIFKDILNCRAIMVEGFGKSLSIVFDLETKWGDPWSDNYTYTVSVIDENDNMFRICLVQLATFISNKGTFSVNINTNVDYYFNVPSKNFKVVIDANNLCKEELLKSKIKNLHIDGKRIYQSLSPRSSISNAISGSKLLSIGYDKNSLMDIQFKNREQIHNDLYMYGLKDYRALRTPQTPLPYNERSFIVKQLKTRPQSSDDYYMNFTAMDYLTLIDPLTNHKDKDFTDTIASEIGLVKALYKPNQHKHPTFNKETTIMQANTIPVTFPPVSYSVTTGFLALPDNVKDVHFKTLLESFTVDHALDFLGTPNNIFNQICAYVDMVRDEKLVHPSVKTLSKVVTFSFCHECLNEYTILAVEYLNKEYKDLAGVDYDFINIASSHTEGKEELLKTFVKKYKRNPGTLPDKTQKALPKSKMSKTKVADISNIYNGAVTCYLYGKFNVAGKISAIINTANNGTPSEFKQYATTFDKDLSDKLMAIYRKSI